MRFITITVLLSLFACNSAFSQQTTQLSAGELKQYDEQCKQLVNYLEGTLNFIGDPEKAPSEKDIIINQSYLKIFQSEETQIEDDLDPNREMAMNKNVQAYLKDVDFFFQKVVFAFEINSIDQLVNDNGQITFKVTLNRNLSGVTIKNDTLENNQIRYVEINLNPVQKDLKIASIYTTKPDRGEELKYWWENMADSWKGYFGDSIPVIDTISFSKITAFNDSTLITDRWKEDYRIDTLIAFEGDTLRFTQVHDSLHYLGDTIIDSTLHYLRVYDTIPFDAAFIYKNLKQFAEIKTIDIPDNKTFTDLQPLTELNELQQIDLSNTLIDDLAPLRNLNKLEIINCSGSSVNSLDQLRYSSTLRRLDCSNTTVSNIEVLAYLNNLNYLNLSNTKIQSLDPLSALDGLYYLSLMGTQQSDFTAISNLTGLSDLNISETNVTDLGSISTMTGIQNLNISNTPVTDLSPLTNLTSLNILEANHSKINDLQPLVDLESLKFIYCDNTGINGEKSQQFMEAKQNCLVVYNTEKLKQWWYDLPEIYKEIAREKMTIDDPVTTEQLHMIINQTSIDFSGKSEISDIGPLSMLHRLENVNLENTAVDDLSALGRLNNLRELNISGTKVASFEPLLNIQNLRSVNCENTQISNLLPLTNNINLSTIYCDYSEIVQENVLKFQDTVPGCLVIYQSDELESWWNRLNDTWQKVFNTQMNFKDDYGRENLQRLANLPKIEIMDNSSIRDLGPLSIFMRLEVLTVSNTAVKNITPITKLPKLRKLHVPSNPISVVTNITNLPSIQELNIENTSVSNLKVIGQIAQLKSLNIAGTPIKNLKGLETLGNLEVLIINNTPVKNLKPIVGLMSLKELKCYRTGISEKNIEKYKSGNPGVDVAYY